MSNELKINKSMPGLVAQGESDNRLQMFNGSNAYNPNAPGIMPKLAKGEDPFRTINLDQHPDLVVKSQPIVKSGDEEAEGEDVSKGGPGSGRRSGHMKPKTPFDRKRKLKQLEAEAAKREGEDTSKSCDDKDDPKLKGHKREFDKMRKLHENMDAVRKKSMRGERVAARLKKCIVDEIKSVIKSYGEENLMNTHGEQFMSDADREVLNYIRSIERIDIDLSPTHNPPVPRSYASEKSMTAAEPDVDLALKAFD